MGNTPISDQCSTSKPSENIKNQWFRFFYVFRGYRRRKLAWNGFWKKFCCRKFSFWLTMTEFHLGETSNQLIYNKNCKLLLWILFLGFYKLWPQIAQCRSTFMWSTCCIIVTGMVPFKILKDFIRFIALSTWISKFATSFVFLTSDLAIWFFTLALGGTTNLQKWRNKSSWIWTSPSAVTSSSLSNKS